MMLSQDLLSLIATGIVLWFESRGIEGNFGKMPRQLRRGLNLLSAHPQTKQKIYDRGDVVRVFSQPIDRWYTIDEKEKKYFIEPLILDGMPSDLCYEMCVDGFDTEGELQQRKIIDILKECARYGDEDDYVKIRRFIIEHPIVNNIEIDNFIRKYTLFDQELRKAYAKVREFYEEIPYHVQNNNQVHTCDYCGWTVASKHGTTICSSSVCKALKGHEKLKLVQVDKNTRRLKKGVMQYICLPGKPELSLQKKLEKLGIKIKLWPSFDLYDLEVQFDNEKWAIDVKDYSNPYVLVSKITSFEPTECTKNLIVVPRDRGRLYKGYKQVLKNVEPQGFKFLMEDDFIKRVKEQLINEKLC